MADLLSGFSDLHALTEDNIKLYVTKSSSGVYVLDNTTTGGWHTDYVGRSDYDLPGRMKNWIGDYRYFKFQYTSSAKAAYELECEIYHALKPPDNDIHPAKPSSIFSCSCPVYGCKS